MSTGLIGLTGEQFEQAFPFHLAFDAEGRLVQAGSVLQRICSNLRPGASVRDLVTVTRPRVTLDLHCLREKTASLFILRLPCPGITLRGQVIVDDERQIGLFLGSPWLTRIDEATTLGLSLSDFANHDAVGEFLLLYKTKDMALADAEALASRLEDRGNALREANARLEAQERRLLESNDALSRAARLKDEFLSSMSHELRTPLNAILGMSESLREGIYGPVAAPQDKALATVEASGRHLLALINDILDLSRIEAGRLDLDVAPVQVAPLCQAAMAMVKPEATRKGLTLRTTIDADVVTVAADERRMKQILVNLLSNAVKFTTDGGAVTLAVAPDAEARAVRFAVTDTGIGIAAADLPRLFTPFVQLDAGLARHHGGTGLGLALTRRMVDLHGGSIEVTSQPGEGSTFSVSLPWAAASGAATAEPVAAAGPVTGAPRGQRRVLIVDDQESNRVVIADFLTARGFDVIVADTALSGIDAAVQRRPDLILMDVQMPDLDGLEATRRIRSMPEVASTPIFALTALAMAGDRERCLAAGVDDYISKPVRLTELVSRIQQRLDRDLAHAG